MLAREREGSDLALAHCWVHVRRKFVEAEPHYPEASKMLDRIARLYAIEAEAKRARPEERLAKLTALRAKQSKPVSLREPSGARDPRGGALRAPRQ